MLLSTVAELKLSQNRIIERLRRSSDRRCSRIEILKHPRENSRIHKILHTFLSDDQQEHESMGLSLPINKSQHQYFRIIRMSTPTAMKSYNYSFLLLLFLPLINSIRSNHFYAASPHRQINPFPSHALSSSSSHSSLYTTPDHSTLQRPKHQQQQKSSSSFYESEMRDGSESSPSSLYHFHDRHRLDPVIDNSTSRNVTTASGKTVYLPCRIRHLGDRTVSITTSTTHLQHLLTLRLFDFFFLCLYLRLTCHIRGSSSSLFLKNKKKVNDRKRTLV